VFRIFELFEYNALGRIVLIACFACSEQRSLVALSKEVWLDPHRRDPKTSGRRHTFSTELTTVVAGPSRVTHPASAQQDKLRSLQINEIIVEKNVMHHWTKDIYTR
jgi:hypothetical protein